MRIIIKGCIFFAAIMGFKNSRISPEFLHFAVKCLKFDCFYTLVTILSIKYSMEVIELYAVFILYNFIYNVHFSMKLI